jgi:hypothetical protein
MSTVSGNPSLPLVWAPTIVVLLLCGCYASTYQLRETPQYSVQVTNMLEGYAAPELLLVFSKEPIEVSQGTIERIMRTTIGGGIMSLPGGLVEDLRAGFARLGKAFYLRVDTKFGRGHSYCLGVVVQDGRKLICTMDFTASGVLEQGVLHPFSGAGWASETLIRQKESTLLFDLNGELVLPKFLM